MEDDAKNLIGQKNFGEISGKGDRHFDVMPELPHKYVNLDF
jgi:hypothetical protein